MYSVFVTDGNVTPSIGRRVAAYRKLFGINTAADLAERTGNPKITESVIQNIESGRKPDLAVSQLLDIARAIGISPLFLLAPVGRPFDAVDLAGVGPGVAAMSVHEFDSWLSVTDPEPVEEDARKTLLRTILRYTRRLLQAVEVWKVASVDPDLSAAPFEYEATGDDGTRFVDTHDPRLGATLRLQATQAEIESLTRYLSRYNVDLSWVPETIIGTY